MLGIPVFDSALATDPAVSANRGANPYMPLSTYIPDGEPRVFADPETGELRVYVYGSYDLDGSGWASDKYHVFSAPVSDLTDWTDHGIAFASTTRYVSQGVPDGVSWSNDWLYAPDCIQGKDGRFYLYFCLSGSTPREGVAVSDRPEGPFTDAKPIAVNSLPGSPNQIDPAIFIDDDGRIYYYWGQTSVKAAELNDDMYTIKTETFKTNVITGPSSPYGPNMTNNPSLGVFCFHEAASMRKHNGKYYLIYASVVSMKGSTNDTIGRQQGGATSLDYAISDSPMGPFTYGGTIINSRSIDPASWNNHGSIVEINDQWYIFYHGGSNNLDRRRRARVEKIFFNEDGSIDEVEMTSQGGFLDSLHPYEWIPAALLCEVGNGGHGGGKYVNGPFLNDRGPSADERYFPLMNIRNGMHVAFKYFDFGAKEKGLQFEAKIRTRLISSKSTVNLNQNDVDWARTSYGIDFANPGVARNGGAIEIREGSADGRLLGTLEVPRMEANCADEWEILRTSILPTTGMHAIYLVFRGNGTELICELDSFQFVEPTVTPSAYVKKLNGNQNDLTITVTETFYNGDVNITSLTFKINNNAAGTYQVGLYKVYVDTKGNDQIRACYIVD